MTVLTFLGSLVRLVLDAELLVRGYVVPLTVITLVMVLIRHKQPQGMT